MKAFKRFNLILLILSVLNLNIINADALANAKKSMNDSSKIIHTNAKINCNITTCENVDDFINKVNVVESNYTGKDDYKKELFVKTSNPNIFNNINARDIVKTTISNDYFVYFETEEDLIKAKTIIDADYGTSYSCQNSIVNTDDLNIELSQGNINTSSTPTATAVPYYSWGVERMHTDLYSDFLIEHNFDREVTVAVVDSGFYSNFAYFKDKVLLDKWKDITNPDATTPTCKGDHGTAVTGIVTDLTRFLPNVKIIPIKVVTDEGLMNDLDVYQGIAYACENGAEIVNLSLGSNIPNVHKPYESVIEENIDKSIFVIASGNDGDYDKWYSPSNSHNVISVGFIMENNLIHPASNGGEFLKFVAPGFRIAAPCSDGFVTAFDGSSFAAPHISALCVMLKTQYPEYLVHETIEKLRRTATDLGDPGFDYIYGYGLPDASKLFSDFRITFDADGGSSTKEYIDVEYGSKYPTLPTATKPGFVFDKWQLDNGTVITKDADVDILRDYAARAIYSPLKYTLTFNPGEGSMEPTSIEVTYNDKYPALPSATLAGKIFAGWKLDDGTFIEEGDTVNILADSEVAAVYANTSNTITFDPEGGSVDTTTITVSHGDVYPKLPMPTKNGYDFVGWKLDNGKLIEEGQIVKIIEDTVVKAQYAPKKSTITFDPAGSTINFDSLEVAYDATYPKLPELTAPKKGYNFISWRLSNGTDIKEGDRVLITENTNATAIYSPKEITVTFDTKGGTVSKDSVNATYNSTYPDLPTPTKNGYDFVEWKYGDKTINAGDTVDEEDDIVLTATYSPKTFKITLDANGGTVDKDFIQATYKENYPTFPTPTKEGATFVGWRLPDNSFVSEGKQVEIIEDCVVTAIYVSKKITITLMPNGGNIDQTKFEASYGMHYPTFPTITKNGFTFLGWSLKEDEEEFITKESIVNSEVDFNLYAKWEEQAKDIYIVYNPNSGEHLFTHKMGEYNKLEKLGWKKEGVAFKNYSTAVKDSEAIYRLYNPNVKGGDHIYTKSLGEGNKLVKLGWRWDNSGKAMFYARGKVIVYKLYNKKTGRHHYTRKKGEVDKLSKTGWRNEGVAWYAN